MAVQAVPLGLRPGDEGEGSWFRSRRQAPDLRPWEVDDRTRVGKVVGFFGMSVCPRVRVYLSRTVSEYRFHQMSEPLP